MLLSPSFSLFLTLSLPSLAQPAGVGPPPPPPRWGDYGASDSLPPHPLLKLPIGCSAAPGFPAQDHFPACCLSGEPDGSAGACRLAAHRWRHLVKDPPPPPPSPSEDGTAEVVKSGGASLFISVGLFRHLISARDHGKVAEQKEILISFCFF